MNKEEKVVFTIPKMLRILFKYKRRLLGDVCRLALLGGLGDFRHFLCLAQLQRLIPELSSHP